MSDASTAASAGGRGGDCDTLYYDGQCPLCAQEIESLRETRGDSLRLVDIHDSGVAQDPDTADDTQGGPISQRGADAADPTRDELLRTLHLRRADGHWLRGADANVAAWDGTRRGRLLRVLRWPVLRHVVDLVYAVWAWWRYRRLYGAQYRQESHAPRS